MYQYLSDNVSCHFQQPHCVHLWLSLDNFAFNLYLSFILPVFLFSLSLSFLLYYLLNISHSVSLDFHVPPFALFLGLSVSITPSLVWIYVKHIFFFLPFGNCWSIFISVLSHLFLQIELSSTVETVRVDLAPFKIAMINCFWNVWATINGNDGNDSNDDDDNDVDDGCEGEDDAAKAGLCSKLCFEQFWFNSIKAHSATIAIIIIPKLRLTVSVPFKNF